jgi:hypothetical protein
MEWTVLSQIKTTKRAWGAEQRLEFIEFRAFWDGGINRGDLSDKFGVSTPQASNDLSHYRAIAPGNLDYDASAKRYVASATFVPKFGAPSAERYLTQLRALAEGVIALDDTFLGAPPAALAMPVPGRVVDPETLRRLLAALREGRSIEARYQSMNPERPAPQWRRVTPHALGSDGLRWHVRAYCHIDGCFKDFILSRVSGVRDPSSAGPSARQDEDWNAVFDVVLEPNPALSVGQRAAVAWEYAMPDGRVTLPVRRAFLYYLRKRLRLDVDGDSPAETPVVVANRNEFDAALASARGLVAKGECV